MLNDAHATIYQGEDRDLVLQVFDEDDAKKNLTGATPVIAYFKKTDGTLMQKSLGSGLTLTDAPNGIVTVALAAADTALLAVGEDQTLELEFTLSAKKRIVQFEKGYEVKARLA